MTILTRWNLRVISLVKVIAFVACCASATMVAGQGSSYKTGDRVEADVNMASTAEYASWQAATVVEVKIWQGKVSGIYVKTDAGLHVTLGEKYLRRSAAEAGKPKDVAPTVLSGTAGQAPSRDSRAGKSEFKAGDRVEVDTIQVNDPKDSIWKKATVKLVDPKNRRYVVMLDDFSEMSILMSPDKVWIRPLNDGSSTPAIPDCPFTKNYAKVSHTAAPSASLFKSVIFEMLMVSGSRYRDFGVTFVEFKPAVAYKNRATGNGRKLVDPAPVGVTVYPFKVKLMTCEKDIYSTFQTTLDNTYDCYKTQFGEWVCKNGAPQNMKRSAAIPNK